MGSVHLLIGSIYLLMGSVHRFGPFNIRKPCILWSARFCKGIPMRFFIRQVRSCFFNRIQLPPLLLNDISRIYSSKFREFPFR